MTIADFVEITSELSKFYSTTSDSKEFSQIEQKIWYEELKELSKERFRQLTRECYRKNKFMPKLADIIEYNKTVPKKSKQVEGKEECDRCKNTGLITYAKRDCEEAIDYFYVARCSCRNGMKLSKEIPLIDEVLTR